MNITQTEIDAAKAEYFASGGLITHLPPSRNCAAPAPPGRSGSASAGGA